MAQQPSSAPHPNPSPLSPTTATANPPPPAYLFSILSFFSIAYLTYNTIAAICRSIHDPWTVAFVSVSYIDVLLLYYCFHLVLRTPPGDFRQRERLMAAVWSLVFVLIAMLAYHMAVIMPPLIAVLVWVVSAATVAGGFYVVFLINKEVPAEEVKAAGKKSSDACEKC